MSNLLHSAMKAQLDSFETSTGANFYKVETGSQVIRILPAEDNSKSPLTVVRQHFGINGKSFPCNTTFEGDTADSLDKFIKDLYGKSDEATQEKLKRKFSSVRVYLPIVVRGQEDKGVQILNASKTLALELCKIAEDADFTDLKKGYDIVLDKGTEKPFPKTSVRLKPVPSELDPAFMEQKARPR